MGCCNSSFIFFVYCVRMACDRMIIVWIIVFNYWIKYVVVRYDKFMVRRMVGRIIDEYAYISRKNEIHRVNATIRRGMGKDIDAACGQLRKTYIESR